MNFLLIKGILSDTIIIKIKTLLQPSPLRQRSISPHSLEFSDRSGQKWFWQKVKTYKLILI